MPSSTAVGVGVATNPRSPSVHASDGGAKARPPDFVKYLRCGADELAELWSSEIRARGLPKGTVFDPIVDRFMSQLTALLPCLRVHTANTFGRSGTEPPNSSESWRPSVAWRPVRSSRSSRSCVDF